MDAFWQGDHFAESAGGRAEAGDASLWPFFAGVVGPELGRGAALRWLEAQGYASPLPLRYSLRRRPEREDPIQRVFVPDYQGATIWTSLDSVYLSLLESEGPARAAPDIGAYCRLIERDGTFWEALVARPGAGRHTSHESLRPYRGRLGLFHADEAMLWSAVFLDLLESSTAKSGAVGLSA